MRKALLLPLALAGAVTAGCKQHTIPTDPVAHHITVFTEPPGATVHFDPGIVPDAPHAATGTAAPATPTATATAGGGYNDTLPTMQTPFECFHIPHHPKAAGGAPAHFIVVEKPGYARTIVELTPEEIDAIGGEYIYDHIFLKITLTPAK
jgi:hypothetical protein